MNVCTQKFQSIYERVRNPLARNNQRTTLPQSALRAASSLREGAGNGLVPFNRVLAGIRGCGRFSSPLRRLRNRFLLPFNGRHSLSQPFGLPAPSKREPGMGWCHSTGCSLESGGAGDFHRPYEGAKSGMGWSKKGASGNVEFPEAPDLRLVRTECPQRLHNPVSRRCTCPASQSSCPR